MSWRSSRLFAARVAHDLRLRVFEGPELPPDGATVSQDALTMLAGGSPFGATTQMVEPRARGVRARMLPCASASTYRTTRRASFLERASRRSTSSAPVLLHAVSKDRARDHRPRRRSQRVAAGERANSRAHAGGRQLRRHHLARRGARRIAARHRVPSRRSSAISKPTPPRSLRRHRRRLRGHARGAQTRSSRSSHASWRLGSMAMAGDF